MVSGIVALVGRRGFLDFRHFGWVDCAVFHFRILRFFEGFDARRLCGLPCSIP